jgi:Protein of unknown function (DUF2786)
MSRNDRLDKVLAVAINPGAYEPEAVAALRKARQLVKRDPALAFNLQSMVYPLPWLDPADEVSFEVEISGVWEFWLPIVLNTMSEQAYVLRLKSKFICDFATPTTVHVKCDGRETACEAFKEHLNSLVGYIHSRRCESRSALDAMVSDSVCG